MQQAAVAVIATRRLRALPTPTSTVLACHQGLGMSQNLQCKSLSIFAEISGQSWMQELHIRET